MKQEEEEAPVSLISKVKGCEAGGQDYEAGGGGSRRPGFVFGIPGAE